ncbi:hypothetical protein C8R45DRAFT_1222051 [Mycena sanguinolenta]|nr:hypothetical protein C8R45DRAFT_1222051 [Mycena sanguinolenta]
MHRALDIANLQRLPGPHTRVALAACKDNPSLGDLHAVASLLTKAPASQKIFYLPVLYIVLDPARIPTADDLESLQPDTTARISCASRSLTMLLSLPIARSSHPGLGCTLWPRVWQWIYLMHEHREYIPSSMVLPEITLYFVFLHFVEQNFYPLADSPLVTLAHGFRSFIGKAWAMLARMKSSPDRFAFCVKYFALTLWEVDFADPVHFMELVDGAGGSLEDLARLSTEFLDPSDPSIRELSPLCVSSLAHLIVKSDEEPDGDLDPSPRQKFLETLRQRDFLPALLTGMDAFVETAQADSTLMVLWFDVLEQVLYAPRTYRWLPTVIRAGLLHTMTRVSLRFPGDLDDSIKYLLRNVLPEGMVYYHVVAAMEEILENLTEVCHCTEFKALGTFNDWSEFLDLAEVRVDLIRELDWAETFKACDNVECGELQDRSQCRRCSGCKCMYYCSQECQTVDWRRGGHRKHCSSNTMLSLTESRNCTLGFRERQFIWAVVQNDYLLEVDYIYQQQSELLVADPDVLPLTLFDYTYLPVKISVHPIAESPITDTLNKIGAEWMDIVSRAERSCGRMQLHVVQVPEGIDTPRLWVIPLRSSSSQIYDAIRELAEDLPSDFDEDDLGTEVITILDDAQDSDLVEIH